MLAESLLLYRKKLGEQHHGGECVMENIFSLCICIFSMYMEPHAWFHHNPPFEPAVLGLLMTPTHSCYSVTSLPSSSMHHHTTHRRLRETINIVKMRSSQQPVQIITPVNLWRNRSLQSAHVAFLSVRRIRREKFGRCLNLFFLYAHWNCLPISLSMSRSVRNLEVFSQTRYL